MPKFFIAIHHPDDYNPETAEDQAMHRAIDLLNEEMIAAGVRVFVGGLHPANKAKSLLRHQDDTVHVRDGASLNSTAHVGGFWVLDVAGLDEALVWGRKAVLACRAPVEVRQFHR